MANAPHKFKSGVAVSGTATVNSDTITTNNAVQTLQNKTIDSSNTIDAAALPSNINAANIADGSVSNTEFQHLSTVTSNVQDQLDDKADSADLSSTANGLGASLIGIEDSAAQFTATNVEAALAEALDAAQAAQATADDAIPASEKGANNGVATLDAGGKVPVSQLPSAVMTYEGVYNASTNTPTLIDGTGDAGQVYRVSVAGTQDFGSGSISFEVGDYVIYNGTVWEKSDTTDAVASVNGQTGIVSLDTDDISEGSNLYFTDTRARTAAVVNSTAGSETDQAPSVSSIKSYIATEISAGSFANNTLSNLGTTAVNVALRPGTNGTLDLGGVSNNWADGYMERIFVGGSANGSFELRSNTGSQITSFSYSPNSTLSPSGVNHDVLLSVGNNANDGLAIYTQNFAGSTQKISIETGNATAGNSGNISLRTGTATGTRGSVVVEASELNISSSKIINVADPTSDQDAATKAYVDSQVSSSGSAGDIAETSFATTNNQTTPANVTGLLFAPATVRSAKVLASVEIDATAGLYEAFELLIIQKNGSFDMSVSSVGDLSNVDFSITSGGQVQYTSGNEAGFVSGSIKFRATTTTV